MHAPRLWTTLAAFVFAVFATTTIASAAYAWPRWLEGRPPAMGEGEQGYFFWHNDDGLHLVTHGDEDGVVYSGRLHTDGQFVDVNLLRPESTEEFAVLDGGHTIKFKFKTYRHYDGIEFRIAGGHYIRLRLEADDELAPTEDIYLGHRDLHPRDNPFTIFRRHRMDQNDNSPPSTESTTRGGPASTTSATPTPVPSSGGPVPRSR
jgi:hypothetical protein